MSERFPLSVSRVLLAPMLGLLAAAVLLLAPALASADSASMLTVVGTSDVSDSGLMANVIEPAFHQAYPGFTFKYIGTATGAAITDAEQGINEPSVLIVHAASLENQFVAGGYSQEPFGRAIFTNDFVLGGPATGDPAGITATGATNGQHNIVQAFADIATAGINGGGTPKATFVSRGLTPGTTVEEHSIWALVAKMANPPAGLLLCTLSDANGGGETPIASGQGVTANGQMCPDSGAIPGGAQLPAWYVTTQLTQGPNVVAANACTGYPSGANSCYVLTDRGTFDYLASGQDPAGAGGIPGLQIVTRGPQDASAPGGAYLLENYFHAYIINPSKPDEQVNSTAAQDFVNMLTSPALQSQLKYYLDDTSDPAGAPFVASASPDIALKSGFPSSVAAGQPVTVTGTLTNAETGYPALASQPVTIDEIIGLLPVPVATGTTDSTGAFSIAFTPPSSGAYEVSTLTINQVENSSLSPVFEDTLQPAATSTSNLTVNGSLTISKTTASAGSVAVTGGISPKAPDANARVTILARKQGSKAAFTEVGGANLSAGQSAYAVNGSLGGGKWQLETTYSDPRELSSATSSTKNVTVPAASVSVSFKKVTVKNGKLTVSGTLSSGPAAKGASVKLFALKTVGVTNSKTVRKDVRGRIAVSFPQAGKSSVGVGKTKFTIKAKLKRGFRYALQLQYSPKGAPGGYSKLKTVDVH